MTNTHENRASISEGVAEGDVLAGKYVIERVLGTGGMGVVASARHMQLEERVAIKFLLPQALENEEAVARFAREARAAVKIKSEHVARVIDVGTLETGAPYMVMEHLQGEDLGQRLQERGPQSIPETAEFILQACEAIAEAHSLGIVHRDLKPANLFVIRRADGTEAIKVLDFGISKVSGMVGSGPDMGMTKTQAMMGSPLYMSPEQMSSARDVDARTDIWALGITLYELLTGSPPYNAESIPQLCTMILHEPPPPLRSARPDAPEGLAVCLQRCLAKDREQRYPSVAELAADLAVFAPTHARISAERISRVLRAGGVVPPQASADLSASAKTSETLTQAAWGHTQSRSRASRRILAAVAGSVAVLIAVAAIIALTAAPVPEAETSAATAAAALPQPEESPTEPTSIEPVVQPVRTSESDNADDQERTEAKKASTAQAQEDRTVAKKASPKPVPKPKARPLPQPGVTKPEPDPEPAPAPTKRSLEDLYGDRK